jgi:hypothetical protein
MIWLIRNFSSAALAKRQRLHTRRKARRGRSRAGQEGGVRCYWLMR